MKTGMLKGEPALETLLNHEKSSDPQFIHKNAVGLLSKHRYFLALALFLLSGHLEDAVRIAARQLNDLQLALVLCRRDLEVVKPVLEHSLDGPLPQRDPWLKFLLMWHAGYHDAAVEVSTKGKGKGKNAAPRAGEGANEPGLYDECLRPCLCADMLSEVAKQVKRVSGK